MKSGVDVSSVFPKEMSKNICIDASASKENTGKDSMCSAVNMFIKIANKWERKANSEPDPKANVVPGFVCSCIVQMLVSGSDVDLHASQRENSG